jgi:hypothetical protein
VTSQRANSGISCAVRPETGVDLLNNIQDWRIRAKKIRVIAETMLDGASRQVLLHIASEWEQMAQLLEDDGNANSNA